MSARFDFQRPARSASEEFSAELRAARKAAGAAMVRAVVKHQREKIRAQKKAAGKNAFGKGGQFSGAAKRRIREIREQSKGASKKRRELAVRGFVNKSGYLAFVDMAPLAEAQEEGKTITGSPLYVGLSGRQEAKGKRFIINSQKSGQKLFVEALPGGGIATIATLMRRIRIRKTLGFEETIERYLPDYIEQVADRVEENYIYGKR